MCVDTIQYYIFGSYFQSSIRVASYDNFGVERDQTPFMDQEAEEIRAANNANGLVWTTEIENWGHL